MSPGIGASNARFSPSAGSSIAYTDYLANRYSSESEDWRAFEVLFLDWADRARALTPRVLVILYPYNPRAFAFQGIHDQMNDLVEEAGVEWVDLMAVLPEFRDDTFNLEAGPFDGHPSAEMHGRVADELGERMAELWPELVTLDPSRNSE